MRDAAFLFFPIAMPLPGASLRELHLFAGIGGGILGGMLNGHRCVGAVELDPFCQEVLRDRQEDGFLPPFPIFGDIREFDGKPWRGRVDVVAGGFPCQDISVAGSRAGITGLRSGLWFEMARVVREVEPSLVFVENSPAITSRGLDAVLGSLAVLGFDAEWGVLSARAVGAPHLRKRMWILAAHPDRVRLREQCWWLGGTGGSSPAQPVVDGEARHDTHPDRWRREVERQPEPARQQGTQGDVADGLRAQAASDSDTSGTGLPVPEQQAVQGTRWWQAWRAASERGWWATEPDVGRVAHGVPHRVDRLRALGNAQVPAQAAIAWRLLMERLTRNR